ncbi:MULTISPECIES: lipopolysaccharide biosynthesis protein [Butyricimonas]|uniref:lipopolysaccharide biosynthesis protein n=1 Tax=Butyricimonas TaxID=574697 RepID=UPI0007FB4DEA|nr:MULTISPECIES: hypothetical protein [Butyricimonas]
MNKVVKNTGILYLRSLIILFISLYSSRLLLSILGVEDFGLYNLVGGIVGMFASLKVLFAFAVQRFLSFEKGVGDIEKEQDVFNVSLILHIGIAFVFAFVVELFGCWAIGNKLNIPMESYSAAYFIFHVSVITAIISIITTPFSAAVIANEKMGTFAWITSFDSVLKLIIVILLPYIEYRSVRVYALLFTLIETLNFVFYLLSCRKFPECVIKRVRNNRRLFKEIAVFAGWDFIGNSAWALINEGVNLILNILGGVTVNAARGVAYQVKNAVLQLVNNVTVASRPYIIKQAASENRESTYNSIFLLARALFLIMAITTMPIITYSDTILDIWLVETPEYAVTFVQLVLLWNVIRTMNTPIDLAFTAFGKLRVYQIFNSIALLLNLPLSYFLLKSGCPYYFAMLSFCIVEVIDIIVNLIVAKNVIDMSAKIYTTRVLLQNLWNSMLFFLLFILFANYLKSSSLIHSLFYMILQILIMCLLTYFVMLSRKEREYIIPIINRIFKKRL